MNKSLLALVLVAVGAGAYIYKQEQVIARLKGDVDRHRQNTQKLTGDFERTKADVAELKKSNDVFKSESAQLRKKLSAKGGTPADAVEKTDTAGAKSAPGFMKGLAKMFTDPEMKKAMRGQQLMGMRMLYGDLGKELGLTPQEADQLMEILADRQMDMSAAGMAAMDGGDMAAATEKTTEATKRYEEQLKAVLGEDKYKQLQSYESSLGDRMMMQQWEGQFSASGSALEPTQKTQLLSVMKEERQNTPGLANLAPGANPSEAMKAFQTDEGIQQLVTSQQTVNQRVLTRAREFLNPDQVSVLERAQQQQAELMAAQMRMARQMINGGEAK
jgi:hypothetical protein